MPRPTIRRILCISRSYVLQTPVNPTLQIFNRHTKYLQRERAAANVERSRQVDYLKDEVAVRLSERLLVSSNASIQLQILTIAGYKSPFRACPRPWGKFLQYSTSAYPARSRSRSLKRNFASTIYPARTSHSRGLLSSYAVSRRRSSFQ